VQVLEAAAGLTSPPVPLQDSGTELGVRVGAEPHARTFRLDRCHEAF
jgi:hypothetical protein